jgi:hypothetical protein
MQIRCHISIFQMFPQPFFETGFRSDVQHFAGLAAEQAGLSSKKQPNQSMSFERVAMDTQCIRPGRNAIGVKFSGMPLANRAISPSSNKRNPPDERFDIPACLS